MRSNSKRAHGCTSCTRAHCSSDGRALRKMAARSRGIQASWSTTRSQPRGPPRPWPCRQTVDIPDAVSIRAVSTHRSCGPPRVTGPLHATIAKTAVALLSRGAADTSTSNRRRKPAQSPSQGCENGSWALAPSAMCRRSSASAPVASARGSLPRAVVGFGSRGQRKFGVFR